MKASKPVILGIFIIVGLAAFAVAVLTLGGQKKSFVKTFTVNAIFNDVSGLQTGNNVWFSGVKIGTVKKVSFYNDALVLVSMNIEKSIQPHIHKNAMVKIGSDGLIGNKIVIVVPGTTIAPQVEPGDFLVMKNSFGTTELIDTLMENNRNLLSITKNLKTISTKINDGKGTAATLINDTSLANNFKAAVNNLQVTIVNFKKLSGKSGNLLSSLQSFAANLNKQGTLLNKLVTDTIVFKNLNNSISKLTETVNIATAFASNLKNASDALSQKNNTVGILLNDSATAQSIKSIIKNLESGSSKLDENLEALKHNFLLRGYFKKFKK